VKLTATTVPAEVIPKWRDWDSWNAWPEKVGGAGPTSELPHRAGGSARGCATTSHHDRAHHAGHLADLQVRTDAQKDKYLFDMAPAPPGAFALTEPAAGPTRRPAPARLFSRATPMLNGSKIFISNAPYASVHRLREDRPGRAGTGGERLHRGTGHPGSPSASRAQTGHPRSARTALLRRLHILGRAAGRGGQRFKIAMQTWTAAGSVSARRPWVSPRRHSMRPSRTRRSGCSSQPIANLQAIQWMIADMATEIDAAAAGLPGRLLHRQRRPYSTEGAMAKLFASETAPGSRQGHPDHGGYGTRKLPGRAPLP